jgi:hypothetical protein
MNAINEMNMANCKLGRPVYLSTPYSHADAAVREHRFHEVNRVAGEMMRQGVAVFSPISHTHPIAMDVDLPKGWDFWRDQDMAMLCCCRELIVLMQPGWQDSVGVREEITMASQLGIPVKFMEHREGGELEQEKAMDVSPSERWDCHAHREELKVSGEATVWHPEQGQLCYIDKHYDALLFHPVRFKSVPAAWEWTRTGCIADVQEGLSCLGVVFTKHCLVERKPFA